MNAKIKCFEDLVIWQKAQEFAEKIYRLAESNKFIQKDFSLKDQLRSAKGSCGEIRNKVRFIQRINIIEEKEGTALCDESRMLSSQIGELMKKVRIRVTEEKTRSKKKQGVNNP